MKGIFSFCLKPEIQTCLDYGYIFYKIFKVINCR